MRAADFDYFLPPELIAQTPAAERDQSRLLILQRPAGVVRHGTFRDLLQHLRGGDVLALNDSRVIPARLRAAKSGSGGQIELLLVEENAANDWWVLLRPGKRVRPGTSLSLLDRRGAPTDFQARVLEKNEEGQCRIEFCGTRNITEVLDAIGEVPLPPYIDRSAAGPGADDRQRYQTVYAGPAGSVAAPTAGLHFTAQLLDEIRGRGVDVCFVTMHVGLGTFAPVKSDELSQHVMHAESFEIGPAAARAIGNARQSGRRVIAVGTTTVRVLEAVAAENSGAIAATRGRTRIFIHPPRDFKVVNGLLTNFHLPRSTLLMLVSAFAAPGRTDGCDLVLAAYAEAVRERYRFYSYGDAMLIL